MKYRVAILVASCLIISSCKSKRSRSDSVLQNDSGWPPVRNAFTVVLSDYCNHLGTYEDKEVHSNIALIVNFDEQIYTVYHRYYPFGSDCKGPQIGYEFDESSSFRPHDGKTLSWTREEDERGKFNEIDYISFYKKFPDHAELTTADSLQDFGNFMCLVSRSTKEPDSRVVNNDCSRIVYSRKLSKEEIDRAYENSDL